MRLPQVAGATGNITTTGDVVSNGSQTLGDAIADAVTVNGLLRIGLKAEVGALEVKRYAADEEEARQLEVPEGTPLTRVERVILAEMRPVAFLIDILPSSFVEPDGLADDFAGSVLDFLLARGDPLKMSRAAVSAIGATAEVAKALEIQRGDVLLHFSSQLYNASGKIVDYSLTYFIPGYFNFHVVRRVGRGG